MTHFLEIVSGIWWQDLPFVDEHYCDSGNVVILCWFVCHVGDDELLAVFQEIEDGPVHASTG